jgi:DNA-directed RNA polymerase specialized sigma24 family protein
MQLSNDIAEFVDASCPESDDTDLLRQYRAGNVEAGLRLIDRHKGRLVNTLFWYTGRLDPQAQSAVRICAVALSGALQAATPGPFPVALYIAMVKHAGDMQGRRRRHGHLTGEQSALVEGLQVLEAPWRLTFVLSVIARLPHVEIAAVTGVPPWTVKERLNEARSRLAAHLRERGLL